MLVAIGMVAGRGARGETVVEVAVVVTGVVTVGCNCC